MVELCLSDSSNLVDMERRYEMDGKIKRLFGEGKKGVILGKDNTEYEFNISEVKKGKEFLKDGQKVYFKNRQISGKHIAISINVFPDISPNIKPDQKNKGEQKNTKDKTDEPKPNTETSASANIDSDDRSNTQEGFINPYNFVPLWGKVHRDKPESHEYFIGNSGQITCKLAFETPFFTPNPEKRYKIPKGKEAKQIAINELPEWIRGNNKALGMWQKLVEDNAQEEHEAIALLKDHDDKPFIPGSTLKGAFRSVAEALSNSCLSIIDFNWDMLEPKANYEIRIKRATNYFSHRIITKPQELGVGRVSELASKSGIGKIDKMERLPIYIVRKSGIPTVNLTGYKNGQKISMDKYKAGRRFVATNIGGKIAGELKITAMIDKKKSQRFIYPPNSPSSVKFTIADELRYNRANEVSINDDNSKVSGQYTLADDSNQIAGIRIKRHELQEQDIVYFKQTGSSVESMGPVEVYRVLYKYSLDEILINKHKKHLTCDDPENLCPACRIFGWVHPNPKENEKDVARKGFIHFSTATLTENQTPEYKWVTIKLLGQPHPSCWQFYLNSKDYGEDGGYNDNNAKIRGRKFYWHQPDVTIDKIEDHREKDQNGNNIPLPDNQNKTVELLMPKVTFTFSVDFENLSDSDLGLLLMTLQPNLIDVPNISKELYHHLGMGKPLGLGSAKVEIDKLILIKKGRTL